MFGHPSPVDPSVVEAARRRLEALAVPPSQPSTSAAPGPVPAPRPDKLVGRHAGRAPSPADRLLATGRGLLPRQVRGRAGIASHPLTVLALVIAAAVALAAWWLLRSEPHPVHPPALSS